MKLLIKMLRLFKFEASEVITSNNACKEGSIDEQYESIAHYEYAGIIRLFYTV